MSGLMPSKSGFCILGVVLVVAANFLVVPVVGEEESKNLIRRARYLSPGFTTAIRVHVGDKAPNWKWIRDVLKEVQDSEVVDEGEEGGLRGQVLQDEIQQLSSSGAGGSTGVQAAEAVEGEAMSGILPEKIKKSSSREAPGLTGQEAAKAISKANDDFTSNIYNLLTTSNGEEANMVASPFSISTVMGMAYEGARGNTAIQMKKALFFPNSDETLLNGYKEMLNMLKSNENFTLEAANRLFVHDQYYLLDSYTDVVKNNYEAEPHSLDFGKSEEARRFINTWVEGQTNRKIKNLIASGSLDSLTRVVLVNAVYFKGDWQDQFKVSDTTKERFTTINGAEVHVDMMRKYGNFRSSRDNELGCTILEMPYKGDRLSMFLFLSDQPEGFKKMEEKFASKNLSEMKMHGKLQFRVFLPKFKLETEHNLVDNLKKIELTDMFDDSKADFSGISGTRDLYASSVMQKAFVEVNEKGSEAAAATMIGITAMRADYDMPKDFVCNRPFLFTIRDNLSGMVLFTGRVMDPSK